MSRVEFAFENYTLKFWRKLFHVSSSWVGLVYIYAGVPHTVALRVAGGVALLSCLLDLLRYLFPAFADWIHASMSGLFIERDHGRINSATWYAFSIFLSILFFGGEERPMRLAAGVPVLFLAWGDTAASVAGKLYGKKKMRFLHGTRIGFLACVLTTALVCLVFQILEPVMPRHFWLAPAAGLVAAVAEALPLPVDDNLTVILFTGLLIHLVSQV